MKFVPKRLELTSDVSKGNDNPKEWLIGIITFLVFLGIVYVVIGVVSDQVAKRISDETEVTYLGGLSETLSSLTPKAGSSTAERFAQAQEIMKRLLTTDGLRDLPYTLVLADMDAPNAFALPGGTIAVTPQLFDWVQSEIGLAFVLAHELSHHEKRHTTRRMGRGVLVLLLQSLFADIGGHSWLGELAVAQYSQAQEYEADAMAVSFLKEHYTNLDGALEFLTRALAEGTAFPLVASPMLSPPPTQSRLDRLRALMAR